jgi:hypothetical protein
MGMQVVNLVRCSLSLLKSFYNIYIIFINLYVPDDA